MVPLVIFLSLVGCGVETEEEDVSPSSEEQALVSRARDAEGCTFTIDEGELVLPQVPWTQRVAHIFDDVLEREFPELAGFDVTFRVGHAKGAILRTSFSTTSIFRRAERRRYFVVVSDRFLDAHPDDEAMRSLLVHELAHVVDYTRMSRSRLVGFLTNYVVSPKGFVPRYERDSDLRALERGHAHGFDVADGMRTYREWLYQNLEPKLVAVKKRNYLTPEEITSCATQIENGGARDAFCRIQTAYSHPGGD